MMLNDNDERPAISHRRSSSVHDYFPADRHGWRQVAIFILSGSSHYAYHSDRIRKSKKKKIKRNYVHNKKNNNYLLLILIFFFYLLRPIGNNCIFCTLLYFITMWPMISPCIDRCYNIIVVVPFCCVNICDQDSTRQRITN